MKYLAVDFETTGLNGKLHQPLTFCAILDSLGSKIPIKDLPTFEFKFAWEEMTVQRIAGKMNLGLIGDVFNGLGDDPRTFAPKLTAFLLDNGVEGKVTIAGKNPAFDAQWLPPIYEFRMINPAIWYMEVQDERVPGLATCLKRAGLEVGNIHDAAYDAKAIVQLIRSHYS